MCTCQTWPAEGVCAFICTYCILCVCVCVYVKSCLGEALILKCQNLQYNSPHILILQNDFSLEHPPPHTRKYTDCKVNGFGVCPPVLICWPVKADWGLAGARHLSVECGGPDLRPPTRTELPLCCICMCVCVSVGWRVCGWQSPPALNLISVFLRTKTLQRTQHGVKTKIWWIKEQNWNKQIHIES